MGWGMMDAPAPANSKFSSPIRQNDNRRVSTVPSTDERLEPKPGGKTKESPTANKGTSLEGDRREPALHYGPKFSTCEPHIERRMKLVQDSGGPHAKRPFLFTNPPPLLSVQKSVKEKQRRRASRFFC